MLENEKFQIWNEETEDMPNKNIIIKVFIKCFQCICYLIPQITITETILLNLVHFWDNFVVYKNSCESNCQQQK